MNTQDNACSTWSTKNWTCPCQENSIQGKNTIREGVHTRRFVRRVSLWKGKGSSGPTFGFTTYQWSVVLGLVTDCQWHWIDCLLAIGLVLVVVAVTDHSLLTVSKDCLVATLRPCACALVTEYHPSKWIRSTLKLADSLALRKGDWNLERTMMSWILIPMHLGSVDN